jgi:hypothetical protein
VDELVQLIAKTYGIAGLIMLSPFIMLGYVWKNNVKLHDQVSKIQAERAAAVEKVQEARVGDAKATFEKMMVLIEEQAGLNKETNIALDQVRELLMKTITNQKR